MLSRCSELSASSRSISAAWERSLDWITWRWRSQDVLSDSRRRFVACNCALRCGELKVVAGTVEDRMVFRWRRLRCLFAQRMEQNRWLLLLGSKAARHSSHFFWFTLIHQRVSAGRHDWP